MQGEPNTSFPLMSNTLMSTVRDFRLATGCCTISDFQKSTRQFGPFFCRNIGCPYCISLKGRCPEKGRTQWEIFHYPFFIEVFVRNKSYLEFIFFQISTIYSTGNRESSKSLPGESSFNYSKF